MLDFQELYFLRDYVRFLLIENEIYLHWLIPLEPVGKYNCRELWVNFDKLTKLYFSVNIEATYFFNDF